MYRKKKKKKFESKKTKWNQTLEILERDIEILNLD